MVSNSTEAPVRVMTNEESAAVHTAILEAVQTHPMRTDLREFARKVHFSDLTPFRTGEPLAAAWETYRREVGRLLAEGHAGKFVLIHGNEVIGLWDTFADANTEGERRFPGTVSLAYEVKEFHSFLRLGRTNAWLV